MDLLVYEILQLWMVHLHELHVQREDLDPHFDSLRHNGQQSQVLIDTPEVPRVIGVVSCLQLKVCDWCELPRAELQLSLGSVELEIVDEVDRPDLLVFIPDSDLDLILLSREYVVWQLVRSLDIVSLDG